jgi:hypothetical protein
MKYFKKLPIQGYMFKNDEEYFFFRDIFIKLRVLDSLRDNPSFLTTLVLNAAERADVVAHKMYGRSDLFWTLYLVNDIVDPNEWIMDTRSIDAFIKQKYDNPGAPHHYVRKGKVSDLRAYQIMVNKNPFKTIDSNPEFDLTDPATYYPVSNADYEETLNDSKRIIRAIRKEFMPAFLIDVEKKLRGINV